MKVNVDDDKRPNDDAASVRRRVCRAPGLLGRDQIFDPRRLSASTQLDERCITAGRDLLTHIERRPPPPRRENVRLYAAVYTMQTGIE
jgi:hypothetical protein